ncbi:hypothetical protein Tco_0027282 [Tanacetum coccineum]
MEGSIYQVDDSNLFFTCANESNSPQLNDETYNRLKLLTWAFCKECKAPRKQEQEPKELRKKFEKAEKEGDDLKLTLEKFRNSSKNLRKLLDIQENDRYKTSKGYHVVPPPYTRNFMPPKSDLVLANEEEYVFSESVTSIPDVATSEAKTSASKPKSIGEPLIEDWISDSEDENETEFKSEQRKPSFAKIEFVKSNEQVKTPRESVKKVENKKQAKYPRKNSQIPRGNQRNWNNLMTRKLGSNFEFKNKAFYECGGFNHLIKYCDFYEKKMVEKTVWNNARRVNHQNCQRMTHPHPKENFVPKAVLMKSSIKTLNTVRQNFSKAAVLVNTTRPINIAYLRPIVNCARTASNVFNRAHTHVRRPFNKSTTNKNSNLKEKVNTIKGNVTTAGPKAVVSDNKGYEANVVKASACWVWRPKQKVLDHVSRHNSVSINFKRFDYVDVQGRSNGCSRHMTGNKSYLSDYEKIDGRFVAFRGDPKGGRITSKGKISTDTECVVLSPDFKLLDENHVLFRVPRKDNMYSVDLKNIVPSRGYSTNSKAFRVFNSRTRMVEENMHVKFSEETPNIVGNRPNWLFDIDALTISMNYKPVVIENKTNGNAGTKENIDAGQAGKKIVLDQEYILLPLLTSNPSLLKSSKDSPNVGLTNHRGDENYDSEHPEQEDVDCQILRSQGVNKEQDQIVNSTNNVKQKDDGIFISQDKCVADILKKFDFATVKTASTPMETSKALLKDEEDTDVDVHLYRSMIGSLMYLTASRPDIMFTVYACARFQVTPKTSHLHVVKRIFRYLKGHPKLGLWYPRASPFNLEAFSDSDYAGASLDRKSTTGGCQFLRRRLISWQCKKQTIVAKTLQSRVLCCCYIAKTWEDRIEKAATTASSLEAEQDSGNINRTQSMSTLNDLFLRKLIQFWVTAKAKTVNEEYQIQALVDKKKVIITKKSVRSYLMLEDAEETKCLPNDVIFEQLTLMGAKTTAWNEFSSTMASAIICLATNQNFNFSKYVFDHMMKNLEGGVKFLMYPRMKQRKDSGPPQSGEDRLQLTELMSLCTKLQKQVLDLEEAKTAQAKEIASLKKRVKQLEKRRKSRTSGLKMLKKGRKIVDLDADAEVTLIDKTQERYDEEMLFDVQDDLQGEEFFAEKEVAKKEVSALDPVKLPEEKLVTTAHATTHL